jgi:hypothetical protein
LVHQQYLIIMAKIDVRNAVQSVKQYIAEYQDVLGRNLDDLKIEEIELSEDNKYWLITVSFNYEQVSNNYKTYTVNPLLSKVADVMPQKQTFFLEKDYKVFKVDNSTGEVMSMKMYQL